MNNQSSSTSGTGASAMESAPQDGTHILAHDGSQYFPPTVVHWHVDGWYLSKWPADENNQYHPVRWWPIPWPNTELSC